MSQERLDWDNDWENLVSSYSQDFRVYTEVDGITLTVYGWDDMESCVKLTRKVDNGTFTYENNPSDLIYADKNATGIFALCPAQHGVTSKISNRRTPLHWCQIRLPTQRSSHSTSGLS